MFKVYIFSFISFLKFLWTYGGFFNTLYFGIISLYYSLYNRFYQHHSIYSAFYHYPENIRINSNIPMQFSESVVIIIYSID